MGLRAWGFGFRVLGLGFRVRGFMVWCLGVWGDSKAPKMEEYTLNHIEVPRSVQLNLEFGGSRFESTSRISDVGV